MVNLSKMNEEAKIRYNFPIDSECYILKKDEKTLGYSKIEILENNIDLFIFITEEERGNGYGKLLFKELLKIIKEKNINNFEISVPHNNLPLVRIIDSNKGIEVSRKEKVAKYIIIL